MSAPKLCHYFVDEAGDLSLFDKKGRVLLGLEGVSRTFMLGVAEIPSPQAANSALETLRANLMADPYFRGVPSFRTTERKTALYFHAKDDLPEVRREVFRILPQMNARVHVVIRRKDELVTQAQTLFRYGRKLRAWEVYDDLTMRLFRNLLHKADENEIVFARRGKVSREAELSGDKKGERKFFSKMG